MPEPGDQQSSDYICPFCGDGDFDLIGLKWHLLYRPCQAFQETRDLNDE